MAKRYPESVALTKAVLKATIAHYVGKHVLASVRYQHGVGRYIPVTMEADKMTWAFKGIYGAHGNQPGVWAFLAALAKEFRGKKGKVEDLPIVAAALKVAAAKGLTFRPGRREVYTAEDTLAELERLYGALASEGARRGTSAAATIKAELKV